MCMSLQLRFLQNMHHPHESKQTRNTGKTPKYEVFYQMKSSTLQSDELEKTGRTESLGLRRIWVWDWWHLSAECSPGHKNILELFLPEPEGQCNLSNSPARTGFLPIVLLVFKRCVCLSVCVYCSTQVEIRRQFTGFGSFSATWALRSSGLVSGAVSCWAILLVLPVVKMEKNRGWSDGSMVKSTYCTCRGLKFVS